MNDNIYKILINLDCIFDVKLATAMDINPDSIIPLIKNGYLERNHNYLSVLNNALDEELLQDKWDKRDIELLKLAKRTSMVSLICEHISDRNTLTIDHPEYLDFKLTINTYPYNFSKEDLKELFICFKELFGIENINRVHLPIDKLSSEYLKGRYDRFIIYDFNEWILLHGNRLKECPIPNITCSAPISLMKEHINKSGKDIDNAIKYTKMYFATEKFLDIDLLKLKDFSFDAKLVLEFYKT